MSRFYGPKGPKIFARDQSAATTKTHINVTLINGVVIVIVAETIEEEFDEVTKYHVMVGTRPDGSPVIVPVNSIAFMEEAP
jgi:hypothetical protein